MITAQEAKKLMIDLSSFYADLEQAIIFEASKGGSKLSYKITGAYKDNSDIAKTIETNFSTVKKYLESMGYFINWEGMEYFVIYWERDK